MRDATFFGEHRHPAPLFNRAKWTVRYCNTLDKHNFNFPTTGRKTQKVEVHGTGMKPTCPYVSIGDAAHTSWTRHHSFFFDRTGPWNELIHAPACTETTRQRMLCNLFSPYNFQNRNLEWVCYSAAGSANAVVFGFRRSRPDQLRLAAGK